MCDQSIDDRMSKKAVKMKISNIDRRCSDLL